MQSDFRYERKFIINDFTIPQLENLLRNSKLHFKNSYPQRSVNSIYFDDSVSSSILENLDGNNFKTKYRLRWYGDKKIIYLPVFEVKNKHGYLNFKKINKLQILKPLKFNKSNIDFILKKLKIKNDFLVNKIPISSTHYNRLYFISSYYNIRATLDFNINYFNLQNNLNFNLNKFSKSVILEIKYSNEKDFWVRESLNNISLRISKNSKYLNSLIEHPYKMM